MPIVSRRLVYVRPRADGSVLVRENAVDHNGRVWVHGPRVVADQAAAEAEMLARDWTAGLQDHEEEDAVAFVGGGGDPGAFVRADLTAGQLSRRLTVRFMRHQVDADKPFMLRFAQWLGGKTAAQVAGFLGVSEARAQAAVDRAGSLAALKTALDADDGLVEDLG